MTQPHAIIEIGQGEIDPGLLPDVAPKHVESFLRLARKGSYDGTGRRSIT